jgi:hypothetical protein
MARTKDVQNTARSPLSKVLSTPLAISSPTVRSHSCRAAGRRRLQNRILIQKYLASEKNSLVEKVLTCQGLVGVQRFRAQEAKICVSNRRRQRAENGLHEKPGGGSGIRTDGTVARDWIGRPDNAQGPDETSLYSSFKQHSALPTI